MNGSFIKRTLCAATILVAHAAFGADAELLTQLESKDSAVSLAAAQKLATSKTKLPKAAVQPVVSFIRQSAKETSDQRVHKVNEPASSVPFVGDEMNLIRLKTEPQDYLDKKIFLCGMVSISTAFVGPYRGADKTHYAFSFTPLTKDAQAKRGEGCIIYATRQFCGELAEAITYRQEHDFDGMIVRACVSMLSSRIKNLSGDWNQLELLDWQFFSADRKEWAPWSIERALLTRQLLRQLPSDSGQPIAMIVLQGGEASGTPVHVALMDYLLSLPRGSRQAIAKKIRQTGSQSIDDWMERRSQIIATMLDVRTSRGSPDDN